MSHVNLPLAPHLPCPPPSCIVAFHFITSQAAATALQQEPNVNAVIDGDDIIHRDYIDISSNEYIY